jgi:hypothetical protein
MKVLKQFKWFASNETGEAIHAVDRLNEMKSFSGVNLNRDQGIYSKLTLHFVMKPSKRRIVEQGIAEVVHDDERSGEKQDRNQTRIVPVSTCKTARRLSRRRKLILRESNYRSKSI